MTPAEIAKKFRRLQSDRKTVEQEWQAIELFIRPYSGKFFQDTTGEQSIEWRRRNIYDSTAVMASQALASSLHGVMTSPALRWFGFQFRDPQLNSDADAAAWLHDAAVKTYDTLQDSNFNLEVNETYRDITSFGTGFLVEEPIMDPLEGWAGVEFASIPVKEAYFDEDQYNTVKSFFRHMRWTASRVVDKFGADAVPDYIREAYDKGSDQKFDVVFAVWPRNLSASNLETNTDDTKASPPDKRPYGFRYILLKDAKPLGGEGGYYEMPVYSPRWLTTSESRWGHSPATIALADVLTLNQLVELVLKAAEKVVDPTILQAERAGFTNLSLGAGDVNVGRDIDGIKAFESGARFDVSQLRIEDLRNAIRQYFFVDQLALKESPAMTATEVQVRYELMHRLLSGTMARLRNDLLHPLVSRTFRMLFRAGELNELPPVLEDIGVDIDIEYVGPLARAQRADAATSLARWVDGVTMMAEASPEVVLVPKWDAVVRETARNLNIPPSLLNSEDEVQEEKQRLTEQAQQRAQAETAEVAAGADKKAAEADATREGVATDGKT